MWCSLIEINYLVLKHLDVTVLVIQRVITISQVHLFSSAPVQPIKPYKQTSQDISASKEKTHCLGRNFS